MCDNINLNVNCFESRNNMIIESLLNVDESMFEKLSKDTYTWVNGREERAHGGFVKILSEDSEDSYLKAFILPRTTKLSFQRINVVDKLSNNEFSVMGDNQSLKITIDNKEVTYRLCSESINESSNELPDNDQETISNKEDLVSQELDKEKEARHEAEKRALDAEQTVDEERTAKETALKEAEEAEQKAQQEETERKAREEEERKAKEEADRKAKEEADAALEAEKKAKEEAESKIEEERKAKEEADRKAEENRVAKEEAEKKAEEEKKAAIEAEAKANEERKKETASTQEPEVKPPEGQEKKNEQSGTNENKLSTEEKAETEMLSKELEQTSDEQAREAENVSRNIEQSSNEQAREAENVVRDIEQSSDEQAREAENVTRDIEEKSDEQAVNAQEMTRDIEETSNIPESEIRQQEEEVVPLGNETQQGGELERNNLSENDNKVLEESSNENVNNGSFLINGGNKRFRKNTLRRMIKRQNSKKKRTKGVRKNKNY